MSVSRCFHTISSKSSTDELCVCVWAALSLTLSHSKLTGRYIIINILSRPLLFWIARVHEVLLLLSSKHNLVHACVYLSSLQNAYEHKATFGCFITWWEYSISCPLTYFCTIIWYDSISISQVDANNRSVHAQRQNRMFFILWAHTSHLSCYIALHF